MAIIITLGKAPKTFKRIDVRVTLPDGSEGTIGVTYKYRTREAFGEYLNQLFNTDGNPKPVPGEKPDFVSIYTRDSAKSAAHLMGAIDSWDLAHDLSNETLEALHNEAPGVLASLGEAYRAACIEGKLTT